MGRRKGGANNCLVVALRREKIPYACGHHGPRFMLRLFGEDRQMEDSYFDTKPKKGRGRVCPNNCGDCALKDVRSVLIRCCLCGKAILPGSHISLAFRVQSKGVPIRSDATAVGNDKVIACARWECDPDSVCHVRGTWNGKAYVAFPRGESPGEQAATGRVLVDRLVI